MKKDFEKIGCTMSSVGITYHELFGCFNDFDSKISIGKVNNILYLYDDLIISIIIYKG